MRLYVSAYYYLELGVHGNAVRQLHDAIVVDAQLLQVIQISQTVGRKHIRK